MNRILTIGTKMRGIRLLVLIFLTSLLPVMNGVSQEYALVLSGGGGKGAYEVGVWKALYEYGFAQKVTVISGTSVGGLNAALFSCSPVERIEEIWRNLVPDYLQNEYELISQSGLLWIMEQVSFYDLMKENAYPKVYVTCTRARFLGTKLVTKYLFDIDYSHRFLLNIESDENEIRRKLLATSAFPILTSTVRLSDGYTYVDGGVSDNIPVASVTENQLIENIKQIFVVYLTTSPNRKKKKEYKNYNVYEFLPSEDLGGFDAMVDFSLQTIDYLIDLGYRDTARVLESNGFRPVSSYWFY